MSDSLEQPNAHPSVPTYADSVTSPWLRGIYQEVDGFHYFDPPGSGSYSAHTLRQIADALDALNKPWEDQIERELGAKREASPNAK